MTIKQTEMVKATWLMVAAMDYEMVGGLFYGRLFEIAPQLKPLFRNPIPEQSKKLLTMIGYVISKLDKLDDILGEAGKLAERHVIYGVKPAHYMIVGDALLWTLEKGLGSHWNEEVKEAWTTCYSLLSNAMITAANYTQRGVA